MLVVVTSSKDKRKKKKKKLLKGMDVGMTRCVPAPCRHCPPDGVRLGGVGVHERPQRVGARLLHRALPRRRWIRLQRHLLQCPPPALTAKKLTSITLLIRDSFA